ncbi:MAG: hypothetical protein AAGI92_11740 [Pseudomonadota bacterium]
MTRQRAHPHPSRADNNDRDHDHGPAHHRHHNHNHDHMHSHVHTDLEKERLDRTQALAASFIEGFRKATDKAAFIELAGIPTKRVGADGLTLHLVETKIETAWQLGTASPAFSSRELAYLQYPAAMIEERETMTFIYVSLTDREDVDLLDMLSKKAAV